jgi:hypothetical protein
MNSDKTTPSAEESRVALASLGQAQEALVERARSPKWLIAASTCLLAAVLLGNWIGDDSFLALVAMIVFFMLWAFHGIRLRQQGLSMRIIPSFPAGWLFLIIQGGFYIAVILSTDWLQDRGHSWAPWVGTTIICLSFAAILHRFPTGEPINLAERR